MSSEFGNAKEEVVTNYYTGEKWFLVNINGSETYVSETRYHKLQEKDKSIRLAKVENT